MLKKKERKKKGLYLFRYPRQETKFFVRSLVHSLSLSLSLSLSDLCLSLSLSLCLSLWLFLFVSLSLSLSVCLSVSLSLSLFHSHPHPHLPTTTSSWDFCLSIVAIWSQLGVKPNLTATASWVKVKRLTASDYPIKEMQRRSATCARRLGSLE